MKVGDVGEPFEYIFTGGFEWARVPKRHIAEAGGKPWVKIDITLFAPVDAASTTTTTEPSGRPRSWYGLGQRAQGPFLDLGPDAIDGRRLRRYRFTIPQEVYRNGREETDLLRTDVWIDEDGVIYRDVRKTRVITYTTEYRYGVKVSIVPPSDADTHVATSVREWNRLIRQTG